MEESVSQTFLEYGLLGAMLLVVLWAIYRVYRDMRTIQEEHREDLKAMRETHQAEMKAMLERYITKAETWMQQYHDLARAQTEVLDGLERRLDK
jgi:amino acid permease